MAAPAESLTTAISRWQLLGEWRFPSDGSRYVCYDDDDVAAMSISSGKRRISAGDIRAGGKTRGSPRPPAGVVNRAEGGSHAGGGRQIHPKMELQAR